MHKLGIENFGDRVKVHGIHSRCIFKKGSQVRRLFPRCDISLILWFKAALDTECRVQWVHAGEGRGGVREKKKVERARCFLKAVIVTIFIDRAMWGYEKPMAQPSDDVMARGLNFK